VFGQTWWKYILLSYLSLSWDLHKLLNHTINISKFIRIRHFWIPNICHLVFRITLGLETNWYYILHYQRSWAIIVQVCLVGSCVAKKTWKETEWPNWGIWAILSHPCLSLLDQAPNIAPLHQALKTRLLLLGSNPLI